MCSLCGELITTLLDLRHGPVCTGCEKLIRQEEEREQTESEELCGI